MKKRIVSDYNPQECYKEAHQILNALKQVFNLVDNASSSNFLIPEQLHSDLDLNIRELAANIDDSARFRRNSGGF